MWGRSFRPELAIALALAGCPHAKREADPARVRELAAKMLQQVPTPGAARDCTPADLKAGPTLTLRSLMLLGGMTPAEKPEQADWMNPHELDAPAVRTLLDSKDERSKRQAAAELLAAPSWIVYKVDLVDAPMALGVKELKTGTVGARVIQFRKTSVPACVLVFAFQNDPGVSAAAVEASDRALMDPTVSKVLRDDLAAQYLKQAPR